MLVRLLLATRSTELRRRLSRDLTAGGVLVTEAPPGGDLWARVQDETFDLLVVDRALLPPPRDASIRRLRALPEHPEVLVLTEEDDAGERAGLLAAGGLAVPAGSLDEAGLGEMLTALTDRRREATVSRIRAAESIGRSQLADFSSRSEAMKETLRLARKVAPADTSLLLLGETGVGKEWLARAIHAEGPRAAAPFMAVNCAAVPESLLESELFGHERGAFTGAVRARRGYFELAHRGTLFLDEIGDLPLHLQAKLLRALQELSIYRIGSERPIAIDVRVMAATNQELEEAVAAGAFRRDLFYRLGVMTLTVPPLRRRREDIPALVDHYLDHFRSQLGRGEVRGLSIEAMKALESYSWPGNVRELINVLERAVLLGEGELITLEDLPDAVAASSAREPGGGARREAPLPALPVGELDGWLDRPLPEAREALVDRFEEAYLGRLLRETGGGVGATAERAGIDPRTLYNKMRRYGLRKEDFK